MMAWPEVKLVANPRYRSPRSFVRIGWLPEYCLAHSHANLSPHAGACRGLLTIASGKRHQQSSLLCIIHQRAVVLHSR
jgi:hypothetical protein